MSSLTYQKRKKTTALGSPRAEDRVIALMAIDEDNATKIPTTMSGSREIKAISNTMSSLGSAIVPEIVERLFLDFVESMSLLRRRSTVYRSTPPERLLMKAPSARTKCRHHHGRYPGSLLAAPHLG